MRHFSLLIKRQAWSGELLLGTVILAGWFSLVATLTWAAADENRATAAHSEPQTLELGRRVFEQNCAICHGYRGDGRGMAAHMLGAQPRDFRKGMFKFRSTPSGSLPTDEDLFQTVSQGLRGTGMLAQGDLPESDRGAVVAYLKTFSERFTGEKPQEPISIPEPPRRTPELLARGKALYQMAECFKCHGAEGRGDGPSAPGLRDDWGYPTRPTDLTHPLKHGATPEAIYKTLVTGLNGTPMPSYEGALSEEEFWALSSYVASLNTGILSEWQRREEGTGQMVLHMHGGHGPGMMRRMPMMRY